MSKKRKTVQRDWRRQDIDRISKDLLKRDREILYLMNLLHQLRDDIASSQWTLERIASRFNEPTRYENGERR